MPVYLTIDSCTECPFIHLSHSRKVVTKAICFEGCCNGEERNVLKHFEDEDIHPECTLPRNLGELAEVERCSGREGPAW